jgi:uncharacterized protein (DUF952 family)/GNAT superfamily N-acetyltransferase
MNPGLLLHLCAPATWRMALAAGSLTPPSLLSEGFVHLSTPAQVQVPANARFSGHTDLLALVIDPMRLPGELRFEPPHHDNPDDLRFPHHYGPVPVDAVVAVVPYQPEPDGRFTDPIGLPSPADIVARVRWFDRGLAQRRAAAVVPVTGGIAVLDPRFPASYEHNTLWIEGPGDAATVAAEAERTLGRAGLTHRRAVLEDPATAAALQDRGWQVLELRLMAYHGRSIPATGSHDVVPVPHEVVSRLWERSWRRDHPDLDADAIRQLVDAEPVADAVLRVVNLAVLEGGEPIAATQLRVDGATAAIEAVLTDPAHRRAGLAQALVLDALTRAHAVGCDVVFLTATAGDWPYHWYCRLGFVDIGTRFAATRSAIPD